ncbi:MAG: hypothetical protein CMO40_01480 [Verrucomicrobiaceae bacterium]|nr:hypothetical protein [Verrucomicrobiaceae bacterium]
MGGRHRYPAASDKIELIETLSGFTGQRTINRMPADSKASTLHHGNGRGHHEGCSRREHLPRKRLLIL